MILPSFKDHTLASLKLHQPAENWHFGFDKGELILGTPWRVLENGKKYLGSGDHGQIYGLPEHINAEKQVFEFLANRKIQEFKINEETGDIEVTFEGNAVLQTFNVFSYEAWNIQEPDGGYLVFNGEVHRWSRESFLGIQKNH